MNFTVEFTLYRRHDPMYWGFRLELPTEDFDAAVTYAKAMATAFELSGASKVVINGVTEPRYDMGASTIRPGTSQFAQTCDKLFQFFNHRLPTDMNTDSTS